MSIIPLDRGNFTTNRVRLHPSRHYISGSGNSDTGEANQITGSLKVVVNRSSTQKDNIDMREGLDGEDAPQKFTENTFEGRRKLIYAGKPTPVGSGEIYFDRAIDELDGRGYNYELQLALLLDGANPFESAIYWPPELFKRTYVQLNLNFAAEGYSDLPMHPRNSAELHIRRLRPGSDTFTSGSRALQIAERLLYPHYSIENPYLGSQYTNYNCANFFDHGRTSAVLYSAPAYKYSFHENEAFTFEFYVKPRHSISAGTLIHLPGNYAISLVSGSEKTQFGEPLSYRLALQLGAEANPNINFAHLHTTGSNEDYMGDGDDVEGFLSDSVLKPDHWHHCAIRWYEPGSGEKNTGDFIIDLQDAGKFSYSKGAMDESDKAIVFGGYYTDSTITNMQRFFNNLNYQGVGELYAGTTTPSNTFGNIPNAEMHEIRMWNHVRSRRDILSGSTGGITGSVTEMSGSGLGLYIPLLYEPAAPENKAALVTGDVTITNSSIGAIKPEIVGAAEFYDNTPIFRTAEFKTPFNTNQAFCGGILNINTQAFMKEWINSSYPYMHLMSENFEAWDTTHALTSSFASKIDHQKRNSFIMPCDNGNFVPGYDLLTYTGNEKYYRNSTKHINLKNISDPSSFYDTRLMFADEAYKTALFFEDPSKGTTTEQDFDGRYHGSLEDFTDPLEVVPGKANYRMEFNIPNAKIIMDPTSSGTTDAIDFISNMVSVITVPQLYYGDKIEPGTVTIKSNLVSGSAGSSATITVDDAGLALANGAISLETTNGDIVLITGHADTNAMTTRSGASSDGTFSADDTVSGTPSSNNSIQAGHIATTINLHDDFSATAFGPVVTITQKTPGPDGNTDITTSVGDMADALTIVDFSGGDTGFVGSNVVLKDDGYGNLYRSQTSGSVAKWNSVGDIYYNEGLIFIQSPHLFNIGEFDMELEFKGRNYANVMEINVPCPRGMINSSSNPNYNALRPTNNSNEKAEEFVYISTVYLHDENLNVIGKAKLAQPIVKRGDSKYLFRLRVDF